MLFKQRLLFSDLLHRWLDNHKIEIEKSTEYDYQVIVQKVSVAFQGLYVKDIKADLIQNYITSLSERGLSNTSIYHHCKTISLCLKYAKEQKIIKDNPMDEVIYPKRDRVEIYPFSESEMELLLKQDYLKWVKDAVVIAYHTGMRLGEIFALKWRDINYENQFIMVQRSQARAGSKVFIKTTKTPSGVRRIDIDSFLTKYLFDMRTDNNNNSEYVFSMPNGQFRIPWNISWHVRQMCTKVGVAQRNFHTLRHTHASVLLANNVHPKIVQERLGHSDIKTTLLTYSHTTPTIQKEAVNVFERISMKIKTNEINMV